MARATRPDDVPQKTLDHFEAIPWCAKLLDDSNFNIVSMSRTVTQPGHGHSLMAETWNTDSTVVELLSMYRPAGDQPGEIRRFYTFGSALNAHPNTLHGGVIACILDSTMGNAIGQHLPSKGVMFTVQLNITYKKPITTPGTIIARSWISKVEDRKVWVRGVLENGKGELHALAEGVWLRVKEKL